MPEIKGSKLAKGAYAENDLLNRKDRHRNEHCVYEGTV